VNPALEELRRLCQFGFHGERLFNEDGDLDVVHYTRDWRGVRDVVLVYSEHEARPGAAAVDTPVSHR
jgi:hypothetical protein